MTTSEQFDHARRESKSPHDTTPPEQKTIRRIYLALAVFLALWGGSIWTWGLPGFYMPVVMIVPIMVFLLVRIARG